MADYLGDGIYRIGKAERIWSCRKDVMEDAVAEVSPGVPPANARFGWFKGAIPTPPSGGFYVVEFPEDQKVRVLAYVDLYGRAFATEVGFEQPPAQRQDLFIARSDHAENQGAIFAVNREGETVKCANYMCSGTGQNAKYTIEDSWYDFKGHSQRLHYYDLMTRAYLAFVYRPSLGPARLPFGISDVYQTLANNDLLTALKRIVSRADQAKDDPLVTLHPAVAKLRDRIVASGITKLKVPEGDEPPLQLVRTSRYADTFYVSEKNPEPTIPLHTILEVEAALNMFWLSDALLKVLQQNGDIATLASCEAYLFEKAADQTIEFGLATEFPEGTPEGEWETRARISAGIERMALPIRAEARFFVDLSKGLVSFDMRVPDAQLVDTLLDQSPDWAAEPAKLYAMRLGLLLADIAFRASSRITEVHVSATPFERDQPAAPLFNACFDRPTYETANQFKANRVGNPEALYAQHARPAEEDDFDQIHHSLPNLIFVPGAPLSPTAAKALGTQTLDGIQIYFNTDMRALAMRLADDIAASETTSAAVAAVRSIQESLAPEAAESPRMKEAFTRLLTALTEGTIDPHEQNSTVNCFLGDDVCARAFRSAQALAEKGDVEQAIQTLSAAIAEIDSSKAYADNETTVFRAFDSYASRLVYNLMKAGRMPAPANSSAYADAGKETRLIPDSYVLCHFELSTLLDRIGAKQDALRVAKRAFQAAPTIAPSFRVLAQAQASNGDLSGAKETLEGALICLTPPNDLAAAYQGLCDVLWSMNNPEAALVSYLKALETSPAVAETCIRSIRELQEETGLPFPMSEDLDAHLEMHQIPLAPSEALANAIRAAAVAALDEGLFDVAHSLLLLAFFYQNDDALMNIIFSLEGSGIEHRFEVSLVV
ncbi:tetratricopeptide repeat protein [Anaerotardibacter muris]|uniref:tetratricopeptide repeat protein n=1 Tax=Anaerotardibacter muris TaxID=2941505 RepID=UPI00203CFC14|nr:hypothetical protein [Anaerotardibacter muris]